MKNAMQTETVTFQAAAQAFADAFPVLWKEAKIDNKKVTMIGKDERVRSGIVADVDVKQITLKGNAFSNQPDEYPCRIRVQGRIDPDRH